MDHRVVRAAVEALESRRLLTITFSDGVVHVEGTRGVDVVTVDLNVIVRSLIVIDNGVQRRFAESDVRAITVNAGNDHDRITVGSAVVTPVTVFAGRGNDVVVGGSGHDRLYGGSGSDDLVGGDGNDVLRGESERDVVSGNHGRDLIYGHDGDDDLFGEAGNDILDGFEEEETTGDFGSGGPDIDECFGIEILDPDPANACEMNTTRNADSRLGRWPARAPGGWS